jgi:hypothetical protein
MEIGNEMPSLLSQRWNWCWIAGPVGGTWNTAGCPVSIILIVFLALRVHLTDVNLESVPIQIVLSWPFTLEGLIYAILRSTKGPIKFSIPFPSEEWICKNNALARRIITRAAILPYALAGADAGSGESGIIIALLCSAISRGQKGGVCERVIAHDALFAFVWEGAAKETRVRLSEDRPRNPILVNSFLAQADVSKR